MEAVDPPAAAFCICVPLRGMDVSSQRAGRIEPEDYQTFDYILTMTRRTIGIVSLLAYPCAGERPRHGHTIRAHAHVRSRDEGRTPVDTPIKQCEVLGGPHAILSMGLCVMHACLWVVAPKLTGASHVGKLPSEDLPG
jgi:hypothetical protein